MIRIKPDIIQILQRLHLEYAEQVQSQMDRRFNAIDRHHDGDMVNIKEQLQQSRIALEHRLEGMNAFRDSLRDAAARYVTIDVLNEVVSGIKVQGSQLESRIRKLEDERAESSSVREAISTRRQERRASLQVVAAIIGTFLVMISISVSIFIATKH